MLNNNQFSKNAISHKELLALMNNAKKDSISTNYNEQVEIDQTQEFEALINNWKETSQKILLTLNKKEKFLTKNRNPKSLMALGAMGAHLNMALQAYKATESDH